MAQVDITVPSNEVLAEGGAGLIGDITVPSNQVLTEGSVVLQVAVNIAVPSNEVTAEGHAGFPVGIFIPQANNQVTAQGGATLTPFVYVVDSLNHRVQAFDYYGNFRFSFGSCGTGNGQFNTPYGIANDGEYLYVTDSGNARVQVFTLYGVYVSQWGSVGSGDGQFDSPLGIAVDDKFAFVVDSNNNRLQVFLKDGTYVTSVYSFEGIAFNHPTDCFVDETYLWMNDAGNSRWVYIEKNFDTYLTNYGVLRWPNLGLSITATADSHSISGILQWPDLDWNVVAEATAGNVVSGILKWPEWNLYAFTGGEGILVWPEWNIYAEGNAGNILNGVFLWPEWNLFGSLSSTNPVEGILIWPEWNIHGTLLSGSSVEGILIWPEWNVRAGAVLGEVSEGILIWPEWNAYGSLKSDSILTGVLIWPEWNIDGVISIKDADLVFTCLVMNVHNRALSRYRNYPFTGFAYFNGKYLATDGKTGLYELSGATDNGQPIVGRLKFRLEDLDSPGQKHRIREVWLTGRLAGNVQLYLEEESGRLISLEKAQSKKSGDLIEIRYKAPRGLRGRFYSVVMESSGDFDINSIRLMDEGIPERVR